MSCPFIGKAIVLAALCISATTLEVTGHEADGLWFVIVCWVIFGSWDYKDHEE